MNFFGNFGNLPALPTGKALLLLDLQNDFVRSSGALHVSNTAEFLEAIPQLASAFRRNGEVVWVRSHYESRQPLIGPDLQELVVLSRADEAARKRSLTVEEEVDEDGLVEVPDLEPKGPVDEEAFLSTETPQCCLPQTAGSQFPAPIFAAIEHDSDTIVEKSKYSALKDPGLILSLRSRIVTKLYICGSLSNISVYATALDAARLGFAVYLVEDCLGYRSFSRHEEAMRRMADILGANGTTTQELYEELDWEETDDIAREGGPTPARSSVPAGIEDVMDDLVVKQPRQTAAPEERPQSSRRSNRRNIEDMLAAYSDDEDGDMLELAKLTRSNPRRNGSKPSAASPGERNHNARPRMRRSKQPEQKTESGSRTGSRRSGKQPKRSQDICKPGDVVGEGDSRIIYDLELPQDAFEHIRREVAWQKMYHMSGQVPRLVAVQGSTLDDASVPIYRHPADESPPLQSFTSTVDRVRIIVERILGHPLNHVLIQLYRDGQDRISEHSDKTLDIVRGSSICNLSLGAQRTMVLRSKGAAEADTSRHSQRVPMPHESLFVLGEKTNMRWLHGIRPDKRPDSERSVEERAYGGERISLTFRHIGTFLNPSGDYIWGQGAVSKSQDHANPVIHGDPAGTERLIHAFGQENHATEFDWDAVYGEGFDVVNFVTTSSIKVVLGHDSVANLRVLLCLAENGLRYEVMPEDDAVSTHGTAKDTQRPLYIGTDGTEIAGDAKIMTSLAELPGLTRPGIEMLRGGRHLPQVDEFLASWRKQEGSNGDCRLLDTWEEALRGQPYLAGATFGLDDCSFWPVLREIVRSGKPISSKTHPTLSLYYNKVEKRGIVKQTLEEMA